ncbi:MAG: replication protein P [Pseudomonadales bacterium]|jgi:hypothetical protein
MATEPRVTYQQGTSSKIAAGQTKAVFSETHIDAINQVVGILRLNYHNQFLAAFKDDQTLTHMRRLWAESLQCFEADIILKAVKKLINNSEYLPTLFKMQQFCRRELFAAHDLPDVRSAYVEACNAPTPRAAFKWSNPIVYHAGSATGWHLIASETEQKVLPIFTQHYENWCQKVVDGEFIPAPEVKELPSEVSQPLSKEEQLANMKALKKKLNMG